jgi:hypothetical protein
MLRPAGFAVLILLFLLFSCDLRVGTKFPEQSPQSETTAVTETDNPADQAVNDMFQQTENAANIRGTKFNPEGPPGVENQAPPKFANMVVAGKAETSNKIYAGYADLKVDVVEDVKKEITRIAETSGGYVEDVYEESITVRVPAARFNELFAKILDLGEPVNKSIETIDVSEYYSDLKSRLTISIKTRARLYALLARTADVKEQLEILKEIKRLTEEVDRINLELKLVENQIRYSRITIRLVPRISTAVDEQKKIPFSWIAGLTPLFPSLSRLEGGVHLSLEQGFAVFDQETSFRAESADGVRVRIGTTNNLPRGDETFWQKALEFHLQKFYRQTEPFSLGQVKGVILKSKDGKPFYYLVGVVVRADKLFVIEAFFPDQDVYNQKYPGLENAIKDFRIK